jgi:iron complex transport system permease protein
MTLAVGLLCLCAAVVVSLLGGVSWYTPALAFFDPQASSIVVQLRLPRTVCAVIVGAGLAAVGTAYQAIFRNYLASPFTLGVSAGAALAASAAVVFGLTAGRYGVDVGVCALLGAITSLGIILSIHRQRRFKESDSLLLVGIVFSFFCSSLMTLVQYIADYSQLFQVTRWMMGGIPSPPWSELVVGSVCVGVTLVWMFRNSRGLDLLLFGDDLAAVKGIDVVRLTTTTFVFSSFVVGWVVAQCGVVGFVGIIVPAIARMLVGRLHSKVIPVAAIYGAILMVLCDFLGRILVAPFEVPAGVFTAVLGGPIFVCLLLAKPRLS